MTLEIQTAGIQSTLQGAPRTGYRHMGMPWSGAADPWSLALANRLVENSATETAIEITFGGFQATFLSDAWIGLAGAEAGAEISGSSAPFHRTLFIRAGETLSIPMASNGMRIYLAVHGGFVGQEFLGSPSTYLPAALGGIEGRALKAGDALKLPEQPSDMSFQETPESLRPTLSSSYSLRACEGAEFDLLERSAQYAFFNTSFTIGRQATRMGVSLEGMRVPLASTGKMKSAAVFPGTVQCPQNGVPIVLLADAQTTGGYPRVANIARCDRHMLGQLRPGDTLRLLRRDHVQLVEDLKSKRELIRAWIPDFSF